MRSEALDFADARLLFDGRAIVEAPARTATEARTLTTGQLDDGKFYTVVWTRRDTARRIISFRRARDEEARRHAEAHAGEYRGERPGGEADYPDRD